MQNYPKSLRGNLDVDNKTAISAYLAEYLGGYSSICRQQKLRKQTDLRLCSVKIG